ncbi:BURP domain-containing protein 4-like [Miscanthus floridulus]|uniref:BURP domain-containing protein 4-like n=1 Tax=Miscanthus floridulus TaxID=154761 RepID=UPI0034598F3F
MEPQGGDPSPSLGGVATQQSSFTPEAYPVKCKYPFPPSTEGGCPPPHAYVAETTLARRHDDLHVETGMLFTRSSMFPGAILPEGTKFAGNGFPDPRRFVFREDADAIPFSYKQIDTILRTFGVPRGSKKADQVAATLRTCEAKSPEPHTCATSKQAEVEFAASSLATRISELRAVVTVVHGKKDAARYTVAPNGVARIGKAGRGAMVPCHLMAYPYMVHYCHLLADVEALRVELMGFGDDGHAAAAASGATAIAMCHANTTSWDARYFQMLNATRGEEICHFMPRNYVLWLPAAAL